jgi:hypothetical protein
MPCRPQTPWYDKEEPNAFAPIVRARPFLILGRPVHLWGCPLRLQPGISPQTFRIPSHDGHPVLRSSLRPARNYPRFWISTRGHRLSGTLTHRKRVLPSTHYRVLRPCVLLWYFRPRVSALVTFPLALTSQVPAIPQKRLKGIHATSMPDAIHPEPRYPVDLSQSNGTLWF